jgi:diguanylate cyclase (GGDEF)-like protein
MRGRDVLCLTAFRDAADTLGLEEAMRVMTALGRVTGAEAPRQVAELLNQWLRPDYAWIVGHRPEQSEEPVLAYQFPHAVGGAGASLDWHDLFRRMKGVEPVLVTEAAGRVLASDAQVEALGLQTLVAVPLCDERRNLIGALVLAATRPWSHVTGLHDVLDAAAARIALEFELERAREQGRAKGLQDSLCGLPNRLLFNDRLETTIKEAHRTGEMFAVLFVDIDRFKNINDSYGRQAGDEVLEMLVSGIKAEIRASDFIGRYGGDEFLLVLDECEGHSALSLLDRLRARFSSKPMMIGDAQLKVSFAAGIVSVNPGDPLVMKDLLRNAERALENSKEAGRNRTAMAPPPPPNEPPVPPGPITGTETQIVG